MVLQLRILVLQVYGSSVLLCYYFLDKACAYSNQGFRGTLYLQRCIKIFYNGTVLKDVCCCLILSQKMVNWWTNIPPSTEQKEWISIEAGFH